MPITPLLRPCLRHWRKLAVAVAALLLIAGAGAWAERRELKSKAHTLRQASAAHALGLRGLVEKHDFLPRAAARHPEVQDLLRAPHAARVRAAVNDYFADLQASTGAAALFLIDRHGLTLAASNWNRPLSFVGHSYRQRPYFQDALQGRRGFFYGLGLTSGEPGLFIAEPVRADGRILGVVVVKIGLDALQAAWRRGADPVVLRDARGIVFLSATPEWLYQGIRPLSALEARAVAAHSQYGNRKGFGLLPWRVEALPGLAGYLLQVDAPERPVQWLALDTPLPELGWTLTVTTGMHDVVQVRRGAYALAALAAALLLLGVSYWRLREKRFDEQRSARLELERRVDERTRDLQEAHAFRKAMEDSLLVGMRARDRDGKIIYVNPALCAMVGYGADELLGRCPPYPYWHPEDLEKQARASDEALQGRAAPQGFESRIRHKHGHDVITMVYTAPLIDAAGLHQGWMSSVVDITAQKQAESRQREQDLRLQRSARLASVGEMASTLAHELNQPLMALSNFAVAARALAASRQPDLLVAALDEIVGQSQRASEIVKRVRAFIKPQRGQHQPVSVASLAAHVESLLQPELQAHGITLQRDPIDAAITVRGDRVLLEQVLVNLIHNAIHVVHDQPRQRRAILLSVRRAGTAVRVTVADQGPGLPADGVEQVFTPFFTTRPDGLGLGLSICRTIVEAHGGEIAAANRDGGGAAFSFTLPAEP